MLPNYDWYNQTMFLRDKHLFALFEKYLDIKNLKGTMVRIQCCKGEIKITELDK